MTDYTASLEVKAILFAAENSRLVERMRAAGHDDPCITKTLIASHLTHMWEGGRKGLPLSDADAVDLGAIIVAFIATALGWTHPDLPTDNVGTQCMGVDA